MKRVLVLGGTGAMGVYLVPKLAGMGYKVDVAATDKRQDEENIHYMQCDAKDPKVLSALLDGGYDCIADFLIWNGEEFKKVYENFLKATQQYVYLSSYRIYAGGDAPITEQSPRLLDVSQDAAFLSHKNYEYSLYKAMGEDLLRSSPYINYTILRPAITYSHYRFQLVTLEANVVVDRAKKGLPVYLPEEAAEVDGTMSWAGDVAEMIARLIFNEKALGQTYTVSTSEYRKWKEIAGYYEQLIGLKAVWVDKESYLNMINPDAAMQWGARYQLDYDRLFNRRVDNSKVLRDTGMRQSDLKKLYDGLKYELSRLPGNYVWHGGEKIGTAMDAFAQKKSAQ